MTARHYARQRDDAAARLAALRDRSINIRRRLEALAPGDAITIAGVRVAVIEADVFGAMARRFLLPGESGHVSEFVAADRLARVEAQLAAELAGRLLLIPDNARAVVHRASVRCVTTGAGRRYLIGTDPALLTNAEAVARLVDREVA